MEKVFDFLNGIIRSFDSGKMYLNPIALLYKIIAIALALGSFYVYYQAIDKVYGGKFGVIVAGLGIIIGAFVAAYVIWKRSENPAGELPEDGAAYIAAPILGCFIKILGEALPLGFAFGSVWVGLFGGILIDNHAFICLLFPIACWFYSLFFRSIAECIMMLATIANNTTAINKKTPEPVEYEAEDYQYETEEQT